MIKKMFILGLVVCSLLIVSSSSVFAVDKTLNDSEDDVVNFFTGGKVSSPNIDITETTYSKQGKTITLTLEVKGNIENRGSINELQSEDNIDVVVYSLSLSTSDDIYDIIYVNNECQITYESTGETENISETDFSVVGSVLTVSFDLLSNDETYDTIEAMTEHYTISGEDFAYLVDTAPDAADVVTLEVTADGPSEGKIGESIQFSGEASSGTPEYTWLWDFGDENTSTVQNPIHSYTKAETYEVTLFVTDADGNENSSSLTITISDAEPGIYGDKKGESSNSGLILFVVIIAIIAIAGIAAVVYIIRR